MLTIDILDQAKMIIYVVIYHHKVPKSIVIEQDLLFISKVLSLLC